MEVKTTSSQAASSLSAADWLPEGWPPDELPVSISFQSFQYSSHKRIHIYDVKRYPILAPGGTVPKWDKSGVGTVSSKVIPRHADNEVEDSQAWTRNSTKSTLAWVFETQDSDEAKGLIARPGFSAYFVSRSEDKHERAIYAV